MIPSSDYHSSRKSSSLARAVVAPVLWGARKSCGRVPLRGSACGAELAWKQLGTQMNRRAHEALAVGRHPVTAGARELGHQTMRPQQADPTTHASTLPTPLRRIVRPGAEQLLR